MSLSIPQPRPLPILGNITDVDPEHGIESLQLLAAKYGPIYKLNFVGTEHYFVSAVELVNELCDEKRFHKTIQLSLKSLRPVGSDGLFTAFHGEHNWDVAHRVLIPAFGPLSIHNMFDEMKDIGVQLVRKWARSTERVSVTEDFTRLTLDSIALSAMDLRFNSFYSEKMHPFVDAMTDSLTEAGRRDTMSSFEIALRRSRNRKFHQDIQMMRSICQQVLNRRRENPVDKKDLLNAMLYGKDPKSGESMTEDNIINNMITFLIAGHETTSGMLSFTTYLLLKTPATLQKAQAEVDAVIGNDSININHLSKLPYLEAVLREALRLHPTAPVWSVETNGETEILGGKYLIPSGKAVHVLLPSVGRDPAVHGSDAQEFKPERMMEENLKQLPLGAWKPFGNGKRGCIGRGFAWQESILALALILQNFDLRFDDPSYQLQIKETLTLKPDRLFIRPSLRRGIDPITLERKLFVAADPQPTQSTNGVKASDSTAEVRPILVLYGSNSGTCEGLAHSFAATAAGRDYDASVQPMDNRVQQLPKDQPVIFITASYEGAPPDNAATFHQWIQSKELSFDGVRYAVFGCGHKDWTSTYQKVPIFIDEQLASKGATRLAARGECDVSQGAIFNDFDQWQDDVVWPKLTGNTTNTLQDMLDIQVSTTARASHLNHSVRDALVLSNTLLTEEGQSEKWHLELKLPSNLSYQAGDYLAVLPMNSNILISRVLKLFNLPWDATMTIKGTSHSFIPKNVELSITSVLGSYVELGIPATRKNLATITAFASNTTGAVKQPLSNHINACTSPSILDILEVNTELNISFSTFLSMLPPMRIRQYSISSSPLKDSTLASITYSIANSDNLHPGIATNYLKLLEPGSKTNIMVKKSHAKFHLPLDEKVPIMMACAGTGLAPFRGFVQERVAKFERGQRMLGPALLFVGCRDPDKDRLFARELKEAEAMGAVKIFYAFSQRMDQSEGCRYVQDRIWRERDLVKKMFDDGAQAYICGSSAVGKGIGETVMRIAIESDAQEGKVCTKEEASKWWEGLKNERYAVDVFD